MRNSRQCLSGYTEKPDWKTYWAVANWGKFYLYLPQEKWIFTWSFSAANSLLRKLTRAERPRACTKIPSENYPREDRMSWCWRTQHSRQSHYHQLPGATCWRLPQKRRNEAEHWKLTWESGCSSQLFVCNPALIALGLGEGRSWDLMLYIGWVRLTEGDSLRGKHHHTPVSCSSLMFWKEAQ